MTGKSFGRYEASRDEVAALIADEPAYRVQQIWDGLHRRALVPDEMTELPTPLRERLAASLVPSLTVAERREADDGETVKWLYSLHDGTQVETVLMMYPDRATVCVSTQAGCAMACSFCATGQAGFRRHLTAGEVIEQVVMAIREARPRRLTHVVFMGMGEPLANYDRTWAAIERIHDDIGLSARRLTVSTVGIVPGIERLASARLPVNLAVSLHAANDDLRDRLVPVNKRYPLRRLFEACETYVEATHRRLSIEWALIAGVNDAAPDAGELAAFARPLGAHVNLIPLNPTPGYPVRGTDREGVVRFRDALSDAGIQVTIRATRGAEIDAACGQLAGSAEARGAVPVQPPARGRAKPATTTN